MMRKETRTVVLEGIITLQNDHWQIEEPVELMATAGFVSLGIKDRFCLLDDELKAFEGQNVRITIEDT